MKLPTPATITDVNYGLSEYQPETDQRPWLGCTYDGAQYHVWCDAKGQPTNDRLYKNSLQSHGQPGWYKTRHLQVTSAFGAALLEAMMFVANRDGLFAKARQAAIEKAQEGASQRMAERVKLIKQGSGSALYDALLDLANECDESEHDFKHVKRAREVLASIDREIAKGRS